MSPAAHPLLTARVGAVSDTGMQRAHNEDRCLLQELGGAAGAEPATVDLSRSGILLAVCDGMGGAAAGEVASGIAVDVLGERARALEPGGLSTDGLVSWLVESVEEANRRALDKVDEEPALEGMGSTLTSAVLAGEAMVLAHVGDSRAYHLREGRLRRVTLDHSFVGRLVSMGRITEEEARRHEQRNLLLEALGSGEELDVDRLAVPLRAGDRVLLCSDGLSNLVADVEIAEVLGGPAEPPEQCAVLVEMANARGGDDNITVVVAHVS